MKRSFSTAFQKIRRKAAEKPAFLQLLYRAAFNFRKGYRSAVDIEKKYFINYVGIPLRNDDLKMTVFFSQKAAVGRKKIDTCVNTTAGIRLYQGKYSVNTLQMETLL